MKNCGLLLLLRFTFWNYASFYKTSYYVVRKIKVWFFRQVLQQGRSSTIYTYRTTSLVLDVRCCTVQGVTAFQINKARSLLTINILLIKT